MRGAAKALGRQARVASRGTAKTALALQHAAVREVEEQLLVLGVDVAAARLVRVGVGVRVRVRGRCRGHSPG